MFGKVLSVAALLLSVTSSGYAFQIGSWGRIVNKYSQPDTVQDASDSHSVTRKEVMERLVLVAAGVVGLVPSKALADVSDGNALPQGAAQFSRVLRLKSDLQSVKKRVATAANEIDNKEWDNISKFLRQAYSTGDDMKTVASGIADKDRQKRANDDIELLRKYAQAGDISVTKRDGNGFVAIADKMIALVDDFLDSLSDVPDEL